MNAMGPSLGTPDSVSPDVTTSLQTTDRAGCQCLQKYPSLGYMWVVPGAVPPSLLFLVTAADELLPSDRALPLK